MDSQERIMKKMFKKPKRDASRRASSISRRWEADGCLGQRLTTRVWIGTPAVEVLVIVDTGSSDFWVHSQLSEEYSPAKSSTSKFVGGSGYQLAYADLSYIQGNLVRDTARLGNDITLNDIGLASVFAGEDDFTCGGIAAGGIFPLGLQIRNKQNFDTPLTAMKKNGLISRQLVGISLGDPDSLSAEGAHIIFDELDETDYLGNIHWVDRDQTSNDWIVPMDSVTFDDKVLGCDGKPCTVLVDSGTSYITSDKYTMCKIFVEVEGAKCGPDLCADHCNGTFDDGQIDWANLEYVEVPCSSNLPNLDFYIGGRLYTLKGSDYLFPPNTTAAESSEGYCALALGWFVAPSSAQWVFGVTFMRKYYTAYDFDSDQVGFAPSSFVSGDSSQLQELSVKLEPVHTKTHTIAPNGVFALGVLFLVWATIKIIQRKHRTRLDYTLII